MTDVASINGPVPDEPTDIPASGWWAAVKRAGREFKDDKVTTWAAALTYYAILSIFPALLVLMSVLGLVGPSAIQPLIDNLTAVAPGPAAELMTGTLEGIQSSQSASGILFVVGLAAGIWSASGYIGAFIEASNSIWDVEEGRPIWKTIPLRLAVTVVVLLILVISALAVVFTGDLAEAIGQAFGLGDLAVAIWETAKWPVIAILVSLMLSILYYASPNVIQPGFRWVTPGGLIAVALWVIASAAFGLYVANFGSYNETYGSLGGMIVFLLWLWISNIAVLFGAELNAELERGRQIAAGQSPSQEPFLPPRDNPEPTAG